MSEINNDKLSSDFDKYIDDIFIKIPDDEFERIVKEIMVMVMPLKADSEPYELDEIDDRLNSLEDKVLSIQKVSNDKFDDVLNDKSLNKAQELHQKLRKTQIDVVKLECDITYAKDQLHLVENLRDNTHLKELSKPYKAETDLNTSMQRPKFQPLTDFFDDSYDKTKK